MSYKSQRIRDPLHNLIEFKANQFEDAMWNVLNTRPFQRLRRVKQLGFSDLVYPGATHSRFAHSVGVFHTARMLMSIVKEQLGEQNFKTTNADRALAAALVHDVGHGPFSHAFESVGKRLGLKMASHEDVSDKIIRDSEISEAFTASLGKGFADDVADLIGNKGPKDIYSAVVSSQFDADRLDYMQRDRLMSGTQSGAIDFKWLIANLRVGKVPLVVDDEAIAEIETFVLGPKAIYAAESYILGLFQLYPTVYFHKTTRCAEKLFEELLCLVIQLIQNDDLASTNLHEWHPIVKLAKEPEKLENVLSLDDTVIWGAIHQLAEADNSSISSLAIRLRDRNLLKCRDITLEIMSAIGANEANNKVISNVIDKACIVIRAGIKEWCKEKNGDTPLILHDEAKRSPYNKLDDSKGPLNQIHMQDASGRLVDIVNLSPAVQAINAFSMSRAYINPNDKEATEFLDKLIKKETAECQKQIK
jgi:HD superfamily phosphohydrolase